MTVGTFGNQSALELAALLFARVENDVTKFSPKKTPFWPQNFQKIQIRKQKQRAVFNGKFSNFWPRKNQLLKGVFLQNWLASVHSEAYTSMPQPLFGAIGVCYTKKGGHKKSVSHYYYRVQTKCTHLRLGETECTHIRISTFLRTHLSYTVETGILTPRQSQPRSCFLYSL